VRAFKFLDAHGLTVMSGSGWPLPTDDGPGPWVEAGSVRPCHEGIHACSAADLAYWINEELWEIELDGEILLTHHKVVARRGRLLGRVPAWSGGVAGELATWCGWRSRDLAVTVLGDVRQWKWVAEFENADSLRQVARVGRQAVEELGDSTVGGAAAGLAGDAAAIAPTQYIAMGPFIAACAAGHAVARDTGTEADFAAAFATERQAQSEWIAGRLLIS
jgi:hypothetical protein